MKIIERLKEMGAMLWEALQATVADDSWLYKDAPEPKGIHSLAVVDLARIGDLRPEDQKQALGIMNSLLRLTRQAMGPGEWFQVIRRNRHDGRFAGEPEQERDLFNG